MTPGPYAVHKAVALLCCCRCLLCERTGIPSLKPESPLPCTSNPDAPSILKIACRWSTSVICKELSTAYNAFAAGSNGNAKPQLPALQAQYADFAAWQRRWLRSGPMDQQLSYWREQLRGLQPLWPFPWDEPRPNVPSSTGGRVPVSCLHPWMVPTIGTSLY